jgi:hypothetical protein
MMEALAYREEILVLRRFSLSGLAVLHEACVAKGPIRSASALAY